MLLIIILFVFARRGILIHQFEGRILYWNEWNS